MKIEILDKIEKVVYVTQPSPIVLVSTIDKNNIDKVTLRNNIPKIYHMTGNTFLVENNIKTID